MGIVGLVTRQRCSCQWGGVGEVWGSCLAEGACEVFFTNNTQDLKNNPELSVVGKFGLYRMRAKRSSLPCV